MDARGLYFSICRQLVGFFKCTISNLYLLILVIKGSVFGVFVFVLFLMYNFL